MNLIQETYFMVFRRLSANPTEKYCEAMFHLWGMLAFLISAIKHLKRKNRTEFVDNFKCIFSQLFECYIFFINPLKRS